MSESRLSEERERRREREKEREREIHVTGVVRDVIL